MSASFMGTVLSSDDPREAWEAFREIAREETQQRAIIQLAKTEGGRALLDASRSAWRERGFDAPFDFVFEEGVSH